MLGKILFKHRRPLILLMLTWGGFFAYSFSKMIRITQEAMYLGHPNVWSDWALHIGIANIFAFKNPTEWFLYHPIYSNGKFTYPFFADGLSGILERLGLSLPLSFIIPSILISLALLVGLYFFFFLLSSSKKVAVLSISIFLFSSGLGFIDFIKDFFANPNLEFLLYPPVKYTSFNQFDWYTGNVVVGLLFPQRGFLFGMAIGIWALILLILSFRKKDNRLMFLAGLFAGILPIVHPHSFIAITVIAGTICLANVKEWRKWLIFALTSAAISSVLFFSFIYGGVENKTFFQFLLGWTSGGNLFDWIKMWLMVWGIALPLSGIGAYFLFKERKGFLTKSVVLGFILLFIISNLILFQPVRWDNTKLFWWSYLIFSMLCAYLLIYIAKKHFLMKVASSFLILCLTLTGFLELLTFVQIDRHNYMISSREEVSLGREIREKTKSSEIFLTAPKHNHLVYMWGVRPILIGYTAWVWNFGFDHGQTESDTYKMYLGGEEAKNLLKKYKISYVFIGPSELNELKANEEYFKKNFPLLLKDETSRIYDVRSVLKN